MFVPIVKEGIGKPSKSEHIQGSKQKRKRIRTIPGVPQGMISGSSQIFLQNARHRADKTWNCSSVFFCITKENIYITSK